MEKTSLQMEKMYQEFTALTKLGCEPTDDQIDTLVEQGRVLVRNWFTMRQLCSAHVLYA
jgi:hypothetical protein